MRTFVARIYFRKTQVDMALWFWRPCFLAGRGGVHIAYELAHLGMFAIPLLAPGEGASLPLRIAAASGFAMTLLNVALSAFDSASRRGHSNLLKVPEPLAQFLPHAAALAPPTNPRAAVL